MAVHHPIGKTQIDGKTPEPYNASAWMHFAAKK
jgi:hypothetical protein